MAIVRKYFMKCSFMTDIVATVFATILEAKYCEKVGYNIILHKHTPATIIDGSYSVHYR